MSDDKIIEALECCTARRYCDTCPFLRTRYCSELLDLSLDLINRQKAEIERLSEENKKQKAIIEEIENAINPLPFVTDFDRAMNKAKVEAIKAFAEAVKMEFYREFDEIIPSIMADKIDNLVKEMTEGKHDKD